MRKVCVCLALLLAAITSNAQNNWNDSSLTQSWTDAQVKSIRLQPLADGNVSLRIELASRASLILYYDDQLPRNVDVLETFWYRERSDARSEVHIFTLSEIEEGKTYYFRLASTWPSDSRSCVMRWVIPANARTPIVIK